MHRGIKVCLRCVGIYATQNLVRILFRPYYIEQKPSSLASYFFPRRYLFDQPIFTGCCVFWDNGMVRKELGMNRRVGVSPIVVSLPPNHNYSQHRQSERLACPQRDAGVNCARGWRHPSRISDVLAVVRVTGLKFNTTCHRAAAKHSIFVSLLGSCPLH